MPSRAYRVRPEYFDRKLVIDAVVKLVNAKRPAILVGSGVVSSGACQQVLELAEMLNIPVATTPKAKGAFPESHDLALGVLGLAGSPVAEEYLMGEPHVDVLLVVGSSLNQMTTFSWDPKLMPSDCMIHINIDPAEIGKNYPANIGLIGDCGAILDEISFRILRELQEHEINRSVENIVNFKKKVGWYVDESKMYSDSAPIKPQALMRELQGLLPKDAIVFVDTGSHICWALHYLKFDRPNFVSAFGFLTMGFATAGAIGGKLAAPDKPVIALAGDGCFQMNGMEIATAVSNNIPVVWIVQNNAKLGLVHELQKFSLGKKLFPQRLKK